MPPEQHDGLDADELELHELEHHHTHQYHQLVQHEHEHQLDLAQHQLLDEHVWNQHEHFGYYFHGAKRWHRCRRR